MTEASVRGCDPCWMEALSVRLGRRKLEPQARGPHLQPQQTADAGARPSVLALATRETLLSLGWAPLVPSNYTREQKFQGTESQGTKQRVLSASPSSNNKQHSEITHFCFCPNVCGNLDSNAPFAGASKEDFVCFPRMVVTQAPSCQMVFSSLGVLRPRLFSVLRQSRHKVD